jgi:LPXTG-site transpeptidase (sortase) family protein
MALGKTPYQIFKDNVWTFVGQFALWFGILVAGMTVMGFVPDAFIGAVPGERFVKETYSGFVSWVTGEGKDSNKTSAARVEAKQEDRFPGVTANDIKRIRTSRVDIDAPIMHPVSTDVTMLDNALRNGAVYYPGSGTPNAGNIFIFGHSSNWAVVQNEAYKTFNGLEDLKEGDEIYLDTADMTFVYRVDSVVMADANDAFVTFDTSVPKLTVSTCNTFGAKEDRHIVEATLVATETR